MRRPNASQRVGDALIEIIRTRHDGDRDPERLLAEVDHEHLVDLVESHRLAGLVHDAITGRVVLTESAEERLTDLRRAAWARNVIVGRTASRVRDALDAVIGDRWLIMKGPALAAWYGSPKHRNYIDVDLLVPRSALRAAMDALEGAGFPLLTGNWDGFVRHGVAEVPMGDHSMVLDLHWHTVALARTRRSFDIDIDAMIQRRETFAGATGPLPTLDAEDTLLHLCTHGGLAGGRRLVWLVDLDAVASSGRVDWDVFIDRARLARASAICAVMLDRMQRTLGTDIPSDVIGRLGTIPGWTRIARLTSRERTDERRRSGWYTGALVTVTRESPTAIGRSFAHNVFDEINVRRGAPSLAGDGGDIDWAGEDSGEAGKARWLDYVESEQV